jgi:hypothetical protein
MSFLFFFIYFFRGDGASQEVRSLHWSKEREKKNYSSQQRKSIVICQLFPGDNKKGK